MDNKKVIFHLSDKYLGIFAKLNLENRKYDKPYISGNNNYCILSELQEIEYCEYLEYNYIKKSDNYYGFNNLINIYSYFYDVSIIYDVKTNYDNPEFIIDKYDLNSKYNELQRSSISNPGNKNEIYEIYFLSYDNILMCNHDIYYQDLLESNDRYTELLILLRFITTIGIPIYNNTKSARN